MDPKHLYYTPPPHIPAEADTGDLLDELAVIRTRHDLQDGGLQQVSRAGDVRGILRLQDAIVDVESQGQRHRWLRLLGLETNILKSYYSRRNRY